MHWARVITLGCLLAGLGAQCVPPPQEAKPRSSALLRGFSSPDELRSYLAEQARQTLFGNRNVGVGLFGFLPVPPAFDASPLALEGNVGGTPASAGDAGGSGDPFSTTNIQETGVDESDVVKNDGQTIFALEGNKVHVIRAVPADQLAEIAVIELPFAGDSLYLQGGTLVAISRQYGQVYYVDGVGGAPVAVATEPAVGVGADSSTAVADTAYLPFEGRAQTIVGIYDVSEPAQPVLRNTATFEGVLADSRLIERKLHLVLATRPVLPPNPTPESIDSRDLPAWLPDYQITDAGGTVLSSGDVVAWDHVFRPDYPDGYGIITIVTMDIDQPAEPFAATSITADAGVIYASREALYVTDTNYDYTSNTWRVDTAIHKLAFSESGTAYRGSGLVPGRLLNQYSLGEHEDYLRVATHIEAFDETRTVSNGVYVLAERGADAALDIVGRVENIAPGEDIYSARFVGDRGYVVTFMRIDPLFVLDLSDPANPFIAGELKVPGYSDHLQLMDGNHLLAIGKDAEDAGSFAWVQGVALSIFDVTDTANPTLLHKEIIGGRGTHSEANQNPKAFNYFAARDALAFPIDLYAAGGGGPQIGAHTFTGLYVYRVTVADGFQFLGGISSGGGVDASGCLLGYFGYTRGVFIGDTVYSVTQRGVKAASLNDVNTLVGQTEYASGASLYADCYLYGPTIALPAGVGVR